MLDSEFMPQEPLMITDASGQADGQRVLHLAGPIVLTNLFEFQDTLRADTSRRLILEMSGVPYVDSAAIGVLVGAHVSRQKNGRVLALAAVTERVRTTLHVTQVEQLFQFYGSVSEVPSA
jgi:anti-anti-sigma factor